MTVENCVLSLSSFFILTKFLFFLARLFLRRLLVNMLINYVSSAAYKTNAVGCKWWSLCAKCRAVFRYRGYVKFEGFCYSFCLDFYSSVLGDRYPILLFIIKHIRKNRPLAYPQFQRQTPYFVHTNIPYPTAFPYGNGMVLHFYQQQESSTTKTVHKVINKRLKTYV